MEFVKDIEAHCFVGWDITDSNHDEFLTKHGFTEKLHNTLSGKGPRKRDWRI
jgi:hypothetical protein